MFITTKNLKRKSLKNRLASEFIAETRKPRQDDDIPDPIVVYTMTLVAHKKGMSSCPYPLEIAKSNCQDYSCDLKNGKQNDFVYLCIGKKKLSQLTQDENIVNKIVVQVKNNDCGKLKSLSIGEDIISDYASYVHICYGYDPQFPPLKDITIHHKISNKMTIPPNCLYEVVSNKFLCTFIEPKSPKRIEYSNLTIRPVTTNFKLLGNPDIVIEVNNHNKNGLTKHSIIRKIATTKYRTSTWNIQNKFFKKVETTYVGQVPMITLFNPNINFNVEFIASKDLGEMTNDQTVDKIEFDCFAPPGKHYKCRAQTDKYSATIPYYLDRTIYFHDGKKVTKRIDTTFQGLLTSSVNFVRCCIGMKCDPIYDSKCTGDLMKNPGQCPKLENSLPLFKPNQIFKPDPLILDPELDQNVIIDIKMVNGRNTFCNTDYEFVKAFNPKDNVRGTDLKYKFETNFSTSHIEYFMCIKTQKISKIVDYTVINAIKLNKRNDDCGTLNSEKQNVNEYWEVKICHGYDGNRNLFPISEIVFARESDVKMANSRNYDCDEMKIGKFRLCYKTLKNAVKRIGLRNFVYDYTLSKKMQMGPPKILNEITSSAINTVTEARDLKRRQSYVNKIIELGSAIEFSAGGSYETSAINLSKKLKERPEDKYESVTFNCNGPEPREFKCIASVFSYRIFVPYTADLVHYDYQGKEIFLVTKKVKGVSDDLLTSGIRVDKCCTKNCCTGTEKPGIRPWCKVGTRPIRDIICSKLERCYNEFPLLFKAGQYW